MKTQTALCDAPNATTKLVLDTLQRLRQTEKRHHRSTRTPFLFLQLPAEIRVQVYRHYDNSATLEVTRKKSHILQRRGTSLQVIRWLAFSQVCRQIRDEIWGECFKHRTVALDIYDAAGFSQKFAKEALGCVTSIELSGIWLERRMSRTVFLLDRYKPMLEILQRACPGVRTLRLIWCARRNVVIDDYESYGDLGGLIPFSDVCDFPHLALLVTEEADEVPITTKDWGSVVVTPHNTYIFAAQPAEYIRETEPCTKKIQKGMRQALRDRPEIEVRIAKHEH